MDPMLYEPEAWALDLMPRILPPGWRQRNDPRIGIYFDSGDGLRVIFSATTEADGKRWIHVSCSRPTRLPSWTDLKNVKDVFVGGDRLAVQVLPRRQDYVNYHPYVLHLWSCLDGDPVPDFRRNGVV